MRPLVALKAATMASATSAGSRLASSAWKPVRQQLCALIARHWTNSRKSKWRSNRHFCQDRFKDRPYQYKGRLSAPFLLSANAELLLLLLLLLNSCFRYGNRLGSSTPLFSRSSLHRQLDATTIIGFQNLDADNLAFLDVVFNLVDALLSDLGDMQQAILTRQHGDDRTEVKNLQHGAFVNLGDFDLSRNRIDTR